MYHVVEFNVSCNTSCFVIILIQIYDIYSNESEYVFTKFVGMNVSHT